MRLLTTYNRHLVLRLIKCAYFAQTETFYNRLIAQLFKLYQLCCLIYSDPQLQVDENYSHFNLNQTILQTMMFKHTAE